MATVKALYDSIGSHYVSSRRTETRIARENFRELTGARRLVTTSIRES